MPGPRGTARQRHVHDCNVWSRPIRYPPRAIHATRRPPGLRPARRSETCDGVRPIVCYISAHGFGHAVRVMTVLRALRHRCPGVPLVLRTAVPRWFVDLDLGAPFDLAPVSLDVGVVQSDSLSLDIEATLRACTAIIAQREQAIEAEYRAVGPLGPALVFADIPALAFDIATRLGVPSVGMTNFSWDWIYADYVQDVPAFAPVVADLRGSYGRATQLLRLPFHGDLSVFPHIRDIPLVARLARCAPAEVRRRLALPPTERVVLVSFGGIGTAITAMPEPAAGVTYVATQSAAPADPPPNCRFISNADMARVGVRYEDLVAASDAVITKPGYGIVSDCIATGTPMVYTSRGQFREYPYLVEGIRTHLVHAFISNEELYAGRWRRALDEVFAQPRRRPAVDCSGAAVAAEVLSGHLS